MTSVGPVLILGGTSEARALAELLVADHIEVISSLAGRVQRPRLPQGQTRIGGFGGVTGLVDWVRDHRCPLIVDATHPFARRMSEHAVAVGKLTDIPVIGLRRPSWPPQPGWTMVADMSAAADAIAPSARVLVTTGRNDLSVFAANTQAHFVIRVVNPPTAQLPRHAEIITDRGPYTVEGERELFLRHRIDVLVTKNSGGSYTYPKLVVADELGVDVVTVDRPVLPIADHTVANATEACDLITRIVAG